MAKLVMMQASLESLGTYVFDLMIVGSCWILVEGLHVECIG